MDCSPLGSSVSGIIPAKILEWVAFPSPGIFRTQGSNPCLLHWPGISLPLNHLGSWWYLSLRWPFRWSRICRAHKYGSDYLLWKQEQTPTNTHTHTSPKESSEPYDYNCMPGLRNPELEGREHTVPGILMKTFNHTHPNVKIIMVHALTPCRFFFFPLAHFQV